MNISRLITVTFAMVCALVSGAQTLTGTYVALADSADRYIRAERWPDAERVIIAALRHEPANKSNYLLWSNLGIVREHQENHTGALEAYNIGLASAPRSTMLLTNRARTYLATGETALAEADLDTALDVDSTLQWPRKIRGIIRATRGDLDGAVADLDAYKERWGDDAAVSETLGDILNTRGDGDGAIEAYRTAYSLEPDPAVLDRLLITAYLYGHLEREEKTLTEGIRRHPHEATLYLLRAMLNRSRFQTEDMEKDLATARELGIDENLYRQFTTLK